MTHLRLRLEMLALCRRHKPLLTALVLACHLLTTVAFAGAALGLKVLVDAAGGGSTRVVAYAAVGAAAALAVDWYLGEAAAVLTIHLVDRIGLTAVEPEIIRMCTELEQIGHLERPEYLDRVTAVRGQGWAIVESAWSWVLSALVAVRLALLLVLLGGADPWLLLLLVFAAAQLWLDRRGKRRLVDAETATAEDTRLQRRLFEILTDPASGKEVRVTGAAAELVRRQAAAWDRVQAVRVRARRAAALWSVSGWALFAAGYTVALGFLLHRGGTAGDLVLAVAAGAQLRTVVELGLGHSAAAVEGARVIAPYLWLRGHFADQAGTGGTRPAPDRLVDGIEVEALSFTYPGAAAPAVDGLSVRLPAGSVVAVVGEYGSGKTTLVKLLSKFYRPSSGVIRVDGTDLADLDGPSWWSATSAAYQDFGRYQTTLADAVALGDLGADPAEVSRSLADADAAALAARLPRGVSTELGARFGGVELSEGQWQKVALARACMRPHPLFFVLDEPTASLDAPSEHAIFQRYMARSRALGAAVGAVTLVVSHRFSTVADADLVLVMERGRLIESGTHADLLALGGVYAEFYGIQASAYAAADPA